MTARHVSNPVILATSLKSHTATMCTQSLLPLEKQMSRAHAAFEARVRARFTPMPLEERRGYICQPNAGSLLKKEKKQAQR